MDVRICNMAIMFILYASMCSIGISHSMASKMIDTTSAEILNYPFRSSEELLSYVKQLVDNQKFIMTKVDRLNIELDSQKTLTETLKTELCDQKVISERLSINLARLDVKVRKQARKTGHQQNKRFPIKRLNKHAHFTTKYTPNRNDTHLRGLYDLFKFLVTPTPTEFRPRPIEHSNFTNTPEVIIDSLNGHNKSSSQYRYVQPVADGTVLTYNNNKATHEDIHNLRMNKRLVGDKRQHSERVVFTVYSDYLADLGKEQTIRFGHVITNIGYAYNGITGVFTCTVPGVYVFFAHIVSVRGKAIRSGLYKNGSRTNVDIYVPLHPGDFGTSSNMGILSLQSGDIVDIRSWDVHAGPILDNDSSFSGFLLYPDL